MKKSPRMTSGATFSLQQTAFCAVGKRPKKKMGYKALDDAQTAATFRL